MEKYTNLNVGQIRWHGKTRSHGTDSAQEWIRGDINPDDVMALDIAEWECYIEIMTKLNGFADPKLQKG